ncbi:MAG TPA: hypothetical protein VFE62_12915 [Gemmataceae bacterium]|nr:hypothetical protein [Gemmataceae bacterium]
MADSKQPAAAPTFTREELVIINNALNEICNGVAMSDDEFQTRVGYAREAARRVLAKVGKALEK